mgnify:CR=1 FL=1
MDTELNKGWAVRSEQGALLGSQLGQGISFEYLNKGIQMILSNGIEVSRLRRLIVWEEKAERAL